MILGNSLEPTKNHFRQLANYYSYDKIEEGINLVNKLVQTPEVILYKAKFLRSKGDLKVAMQILNSIQNDQSYGSIDFGITLNILLTKSSIYYSQGQIHTAIDILGKYEELRNSNKYSTEEDIQFSNKQTYLLLKMALQSSLGNYKEAIHIGKDAIQFFDETQNDEYKNYMYTNLGAIYRELGENKKSIQYHKLSLDYFNRIDNTGRMSINPLYQIGSNYSDMSKYDLARKYFFDSLKLAKEACLKNHILSNLHAIAIIESIQNNFDRAIELELEAIMISKEISANASYINIAMTLAITYQKIGDYSRAQNLYIEIEDMLEKYGTDATYGVFYTNYGNMLVQLGEIKEAAKYLEAALANKKERGNIIEQAITLRSLASLSRISGEYETALIYLDDALKTFETKELNDLTLKTKYDIAQLLINNKLFLKAKLVLKDIEQLSSIPSNQFLWYLCIIVKIALELDSKLDQSISELDQHQCNLSNIFDSDDVPFEILILAWILEFRIALLRIPFGILPATHLNEIMQILEKIAIENNAITVLVDVYILRGKLSIMLNNLTEARMFFEEALGVSKDKKINHYTQECQIELDYLFKLSNEWKNTAPKSNSDMIQISKINEFIKNKGGTMGRRVFF